MKNLSDILWWASEAYSDHPNDDNPYNFNDPKWHRQAHQDIKSLFKELMIEVIGEKDDILRLSTFDETKQAISIRDTLRQKQLSKLEELLKKL